MAGGIFPDKELQKTFDSPFGFTVFLEKSQSPNPNRYFSHLLFRDYFKNVPLFLQKVATPIESAYLSCAIAKITIHVLLLFLLASFISETNRLYKKKFLIAALLISPMFQVNGYRHYMGIIDESTTHTFFYALPIVFLLLFYYPFYIKKDDIRLFNKVSLVLLIPVITLSGPLNPGVILIISLLFCFHFLLFKKSDIFPEKNNRTALNILITIFAAYSLYLGTYNSIELEHKISLFEAYSRLPRGIYYQFTQKLGFPILFLIITLNILLLLKSNKIEGQKIILFSKWIGLFIILYILLLPLGGYRDSRPNILRYDTILPITLCLLFVFGKTTLFLIGKNFKYKKMYFVTIVSILIIFTYTDKPCFDKNDCDRKNLVEIAISKNIVDLKQTNCEILSWSTNNSIHKTELIFKLLKYWNIIREQKTVSFPPQQLQPILL